MPADPLLFDRLKSYLSRQPELDDLHLQENFAWPPQLLPLRESFPSFQWVRVGDATDGRTFGIRRLVDQSPFRLSDLRASGYRTESVRHPVRPPVKGSVEHYLVAELLTPETAVVYLCMCTPSQEWFVLDEHRIGRK
jgi:hypothetical protein